MSHLEVRVGDSEVTANPKSPNLNKMCHNKLCYRSGDDNTGNLGAYVDEDCITPLNGK